MIEAAMMDVETAEASPIFAIGQIVNGEAPCHCGAEAVLTVANGADPEPEPVCFEHGAEWLDFTREAVARLFGPKEAA